MERAIAPKPVDAVEHLAAKSTRVVQLEDVKKDGETVVPANEETPSKIAVGSSG